MKYTTLQLHEIYILFSYIKKKKFILHFAEKRMQILLAKSMQSKKQLSPSHKLPFETSAHFKC